MSLNSVIDRHSFPVHQTNSGDYGFYVVIPIPHKVISAEPFITYNSQYMAGSDKWVMEHTREDVANSLPHLEHVDEYTWRDFIFPPENPVRMIKGDHVPFFSLKYLRGQNSLLGIDPDMNLLIPKVDNVPLTPDIYQRSPQAEYILKEDHNPHVVLMDPSEATSFGDVSLNPQGWMFSAPVYKSIPVRNFVDALLLRNNAVFYLNNLLSGIDSRKQYIKPTKKVTGNWKEELFPARSEPNQLKLELE